MSGNQDLKEQRWNHPVRARLEAGEFVLGLTMTTNCLEAAALGATLGFHFLWIEMEHSPITLETLRAFVLATRGSQAAILARVPVIELWTAKRVMDQGVTGVIFPFTSTAELARTAVAACKYPPLGRRGSGAGLATLTWPEPGNYYDSSDTNILVVCIVEEACSIENIEEIASTPGLDVIFIGTSDLSFSLGLRGRQDDALLQQAISKISAAAVRHGKFLGRPAGTADDVLRYRKEGFQFFQCSTELALMRMGAEEILTPLGIGGISPHKRVLY
jgi:2-keto-3-deoxy-L-rhamnonate aldolase RhmA